MEALVEGGEQFVEDADSIDYTMEALTSSGYSKKTVEKVRTFSFSFSFSFGPSSTRCWCRGRRLSWPSSL